MNPTKYYCLSHMQILITLGVDDMTKGSAIIDTTLSSRSASLNNIDYRNFNSLQRKGDPAAESRYDQLLAKVGRALAHHPEFITLLSFITLFSEIDLGVSSAKGATAVN